MLDTFLPLLTKEVRVKDNGDTLSNDSASIDTPYHGSRLDVFLAAGARPFISSSLLYDLESFQFEFTRRQVHGTLW